MDNGVCMHACVCICVCVCEQDSIGLVIERFQV